MEEAKWYVVHTRTGYENKVKTDLEKTVENRNMQDLIQEIKVPTEEVVEIKETKDKVTRKLVQRKLYPCYLMVKMIMNTETWYIVRNATGVTGFVGPGSEPVPLTDAEVEEMGVERSSSELSYGVGDEVRVIDGPLENFVGKVESINTEQQKLTIVVNMFGRDTAVDLDFLQVKRV